MCIDLDGYFATIGREPFVHDMEGYVYVGLRFDAEPCVFDLDGYFATIGREPFVHDMEGYV